MLKVSNTHTHTVIPVVCFDVSLISSVALSPSRQCEREVWAPPPGLQCVLQHTAGHARHGAAVVEQSGEESQHGCGEVHCEIHQPSSVGTGNLLRPLQRSDVWQHDCKFVLSTQFIIYIKAVGFDHQSTLSPSKWQFCFANEFKLNSKSLHWHKYWELCSDALALALGLCCFACLDTHTPVYIRTHSWQ